MRIASRTAYILGLVASLFVWVLATMLLGLLGFLLGWSIALLVGWVVYKLWPAHWPMSAIIVAVAILMVPFVTFWVHR